MTETIPQEKVYCGFNTGEMVGYTQLYHDWLDDILGIDNIAEMKVVLYIFRHTCGLLDTLFLLRYNPIENKLISN